MNDLEMIDISEEESKNKKIDKFMLFVYISLIILVVLALVVYFFGYNLLKDYIKV